MGPISESFPLRTAPKNYGMVAEIRASNPDMAVSCMEGITRYDKLRWKAVITDFSKTGL